jgi:hypothetical protein
VPPIWRFADRRMQAPRDLQWGVEAVLWWFLEADLHDTDDSDDHESAEAVKRFIGAMGLIDAEDFSRVRNLIDAETINGCCEESAPDTPGSACDMCMWCQAMILRDWLDGLLDAVGSYRSPHVEAYCAVIDPAEPAKAWRTNDCGCHEEVPTDAVSTH